MWIAAWGCVLAAVAQVEDRPMAIIVVGAPGTADYGKQFDQWATRLARASEQGGAQVVRVGPGAAESPEGSEDRDVLQRLLAAQPPRSPHPLWLVLVGHGAYDRRKATFNLRGPDVSAEELAQWLAPLARPVAVVNCAAASGPFLPHLAAPGRIVVTATRSGAEQSFARFGDYFSQAIGDASADLDKDEQVSLLEAFLAASARVEEFYRQEGRLATEHALLDDTGDGQGTPAAWFRGVRATQAAQEGAEIDGLRASQAHLIPSAPEEALSAEQRAQRDALEAEIENLRRRKSELEEEDYYAALEALLVRLATLYAKSDNSNATAK